MKPAPEAPVLPTHHRPVYQCVACGNYFPDTKFPYRGTDNRCVYCIATANERARQEVVYDECREAYGRLLKEAKTELSRVPTSERLLAALVDQWGSLESFAMEWFEDHQRARAKTPGSKAVLDAKSMIAKLILRHNEKHPIDDVTQLSDKDLTAEITRVALEAVGDEKMDAARFALLKAFLEASQYKNDPDQQAHGGIVEAETGGPQGLPAPPPSATVLPDDVQ